MWDFQNIVVYIIVALAVLWLAKKLFWKKKKNGSLSCGKDKCGC